VDLTKENSISFQWPFAIRKLRWAWLLFSNLCGFLFAVMCSLTQGGPFAFVYIQNTLWFHFLWEASLNFKNGRRLGRSALGLCWR
jgi:hypothetical protein